MTRALVALVTVALLVAAGRSWLAADGPGIRPDIVLPGIDGKELRLADYRGRPLLVTFWATTCPACLREMPHLIDLHRELAPRGLEIIGIAMYYDPPSNVLALRDTRHLPYPIALDLHADAARAFGEVRLTPTSFLIAPDGRIVYRKTGALDLARLREEITGMLPATGTAAACTSGRRNSGKCSG
jgi:peroxiredoxin